MAKGAGGLVAAQASFDEHHEEVMVKRVCGLILGALLGAVCLALPPSAGVPEAFAHGAHEHFAAGEPGDPQNPFRVVKITMLEDGKKMLFEPAVVEVRLGEQVRFEIFNEGSWNHEFVLASRPPIESTPS